MQSEVEKCGQMPEQSARRRRALRTWSLLLFAALVILLIGSAGSIWQP